MSLFLLRLLYGMDAVVLLWAIIVAALEMLEVKPTLDCVTRTIDDPMDSTVGAQVNDSKNELPSCRLFCTKRKNSDEGQTFQFLVVFRRTI